MTEYLLVFHKQDALIFPFSKTLKSTFDVSSKDDKTLTWNHLIRMTVESVGGRIMLKDLYDLLEQHPKALNNPHYRERIRATIYENKHQFIPCGNGEYSLRYTVA